MVSFVGWEVVMARHPDVFVGRWRGGDVLRLGEVMPAPDPDTWGATLNIRHPDRVGFTRLLPAADPVSSTDFLTMLAGSTEREPTLLAALLPRPGELTEAELRAVFAEVLTDNVTRYDGRAATTAGRRWGLVDESPDRIDLLQVHVWEDRWAEDPRWQNTLGRLKDDELVNAIGISVNRWEPANCLRALDSGMVDVIQVIYAAMRPSTTRVSTVQARVYILLGLPALIRARHGRGEGATAGMFISGTPCGLLVPKLCGGVRGWLVCSAFHCAVSGRAWSGVWPGPGGVRQAGGGGGIQTDPGVLPGPVNG